MTIIKKITIALFSLFTFQCCFADDISTFILKLHNKSHSTLLYKEIKAINPENTIFVSPKMIPPNTDAIIIGTTTVNYNLQAELLFNDKNTNDDSIFIIHVYRKFQPGQLVLSMSNPKYNAHIDSRTINPSENPRALLYNAAEVTISP